MLEGLHQFGSLMLTRGCFGWIVCGKLKLIHLCFMTLRNAVLYVTFTQAAMTFFSLPVAVAHLLCHVQGKGPFIISSNNISNYSAKTV